MDTTPHEDSMHRVLDEAYKQQREVQLCVGDERPHGLIDRLTNDMVTIRPRSGPGTAARSPTTVRISKIDMVKELR